MWYRLADKAIDLVDEACARLRTEIDSMPAELDELTRRVMRLEIEEAALAKETDPASRQRLAGLRRELADLRGEADAKRAQWEAERQAIRRVQELRSRANAPTWHHAPGSFSRPRIASSSRPARTIPERGSSSLDSMGIDIDRHFITWPLER